MNDSRARQQQLDQQRRQFQQAILRGQLAAVDRFGHPLAEGDEVLLRAEVDMAFTVAAVAPVMDPQAPPGLMQLTLTTTFPYRLRAGQPWLPLVLIGRRQEVPAPSPNGERDHADAPAPASDEFPDVQPPKIVL